jgi:hypothetical protein
MRRGSLRVVLLALALAAPASQAPAVDGIGGGGFVMPGSSLCPGDVDPGALGTAIDALRDTAPGACPGVASCEQAALGLGQAFDAICASQPSRAVSSAARAVQQLERAGAISQQGSYPGSPVSHLLIAAEATVAEAREDLDAGMARLCASARAQQGRGLDRIDEALDRADLALASGPASSALQELGRALQGIESAAKGIASSLSRCWPRACRGAAVGSFRHGAAQNASLELVPVDRGVVALYRVTSDSTSGFGDVSGTLRLAHQGTSRVRATGQLLMSIAPGAVLVDGDLSTQACVDANGWVAYSNVSERYRLDNETLGPGQLSSNLRLAPGAAGLPPLSLLPAVPQARALRVGDELSSPGFGREGTLGGVRGRDMCTASHRVTAIEELRVEAGSFEAARIDSSLRCGEGAQVDWITWVVSELGYARFEMRSAHSFVTLELVCVETPETPGACPEAASSPGADGSGGGGFGVQGIDISFALSGGFVIQAPTPSDPP